MDLKIEIPDIVEDIEITMEEAFTYVSSRKGVPLQNLIELLIPQIILVLKKI